MKILKRWLRLIRLNCEQAVYLFRYGSPEGRQASGQDKAPPKSKKALVLFYTKTGNVKYAAQQFQKYYDADIEEIIDLKNRKGKINYVLCSFWAIFATKTRIADCKYDPADYDLVVFGFPVWVSSLPPAVRTYMGKYSKSMQRVLLFGSFGTYSVEPAFDELKATFLSHAEIESEFSFCLPKQKKENFHEVFDAYFKELDAA